MRRIIAYIIMMLLAVSAISARNINVHGKVTLKGTNEPASFASILDGKTRKFIAITGEDGGFNINADSDGSLVFAYMDCDEVVENIKGRHIINVSLIPRANELDEVVVTAVGKYTGLMTEPADLDLEGNTLRLKTKVKIPSKLFNTDSRMIIQPAIYNVSRRHISYLTPIVLDGKRYSITQERMYDWDAARDSLSPYKKIISAPTRKNPEIVYIIDSLHVSHPKDDFMGIIMSSVEDYNRVTYTDTFEVARGTVNPLRFLTYSLTPMRMNEQAYLPTPEVELRDTRGEINLIFPVGKSKLDLNLGNNSHELETLIAELNAIYNDPNATLKSFTISGQASPEGKYDTNKTLAEARMNAAMQRILQNIDPSVRQNANISSQASVATWEDVVAMMRADGYLDEAEAVQAIINRNTGNGRSWSISRLPFYKSLIAEQYLPRLRRVNYSIVSSLYRPLNDEEIRELYHTNPKGLSRYQFYRYYSTLDGDAKEKAIREALTVYPDFTVAATDLSEIMLARDENPIEVLDPLFKDAKKWVKLPQSTRLNMGIACMKSNRFSEADEILSTLPDIPETHKAKIYAAAQNGRFHEVIQEINEDSPLNEVLLLLTLKNNHLAWEKAQLLGNSAVEEYVKAVAANRLDNYIEASEHLNNAFHLDPSLKEVAKTDGDVIDLLDAKELNDPNDKE